MLVLSRKQNESVLLPEAGITITVLKIKGGRIQIGIDAPTELSILRGEIGEETDSRLAASECAPLPVIRPR
ncbi:hypothetical protein LF1_45410 [Rubripirellula obstinata]|uniref:Translational regulator CsrA n=1 Tax=Rubripirellula obstinata TaxID=406547 RepID=A0A5B1CQR0_9BACT|nr:carbon storage regulator [Rubripirellula obstinata]KAA1261980.1 hypothetical protein LF1_45410 [Rubripirellula obstinata]